MSLTPEQIIEHLSLIEKKCNDQYDTYHKSPVYEGLKNRCRLIDDAIDLNFKENEAFISEIAPPVVRKDYYETSAFLAKYFSQDPIIKMTSIGGTPATNAENIKIILNANYTATRYREYCLTKAFDSIARYGTAVIFSRFDDAYRGTGLQTQADPSQTATSPYKRVDAQGRKAIINESVHPLNYFCNPDASYFSRKTYEGFIDQWLFSELMQLQDSPLYFQEKLKEVIDACKRGQKDEFWYGGMDAEAKKDYSRASINPIRQYTRLNFEGNEDDECTYYCETLGGKLIRCHEVDLDQGYVPLQTGVYIPRPDTWWGNSSVDLKIPFQNLKNWLINTEIESVMKQNDRMILVRRGGPIDVADINNRHANSGIVFYNGTDGEDPKNMMYPVQFQNPARQDLDWLNREINQMIQENSAVVNLQNKYNQGGMNNQTLGAAQMVAGIGQTLLDFTMGNVANLLERVAEVNCIMMIQNFGDKLQLRKSENQSQVEIEKKEIIGEYVFRAESSVMVNDQQERTNKGNYINQALNWLGTGRKEFQQLNIAEFIKDWLRACVGNNADLTTYMNAQVPPPAPPPPPDKPTVSISYENLPPAAQIQLLQQIGIKVGPGDLLPAVPQIPGARPALPAPQPVPMGAQ